MRTVSARRPSPYANHITFLACFRIVVRKSNLLFAEPFTGPSNYLITLWNLVYLKSEGCVGDFMLTDRTLTRPSEQLPFINYCVLTMW